MVKTSPSPKHSKPKDEAESPTENSPAVASKAATVRGHIFNFFKAIHDAIGRHRALVIILAIPLAFLLVEVPSNDGFLENILSYYLIINLIVLAVLFAIVYFIGQRSRIAVTVFLVLAFVFGLANYYLDEFKGLPLVPADILAAGTAADVSGNYTFDITGPMIFCAVLFAIYMVCLWCVPKIKINVRRLIGSTTAGVVIVICFVSWINFVDIEETYGVSV
ncbi:MAG: hypothetical protein LUB61_04125, partial [Eggerthellaceae bacterium]|nr:hypothetical protein [Eggerthellaceae bacterium]